MIDVMAVQRECQRRADDALQPWGERAPAPVAGESVDAYRSRLLDIAQQRLPEGHEYRSVRLDQLGRNAFRNYETLIYPEARAAGERLDSAAVGEEREITRIEPNGNKSITFLRRDSFVNDFVRRGRRVVSFWSDHGRMDANGRLLR
jgi:hypothetical protein